MRGWIVGCVVLGLIVLLAGQFRQTSPEQESVSGGDSSQRYFRFNIGSEPPTLDSLQALDSVSIGVIQNIQRGLTFYDENERVVPAYATHWDKSADGKRYVFYLRKDGKWSDGKPVTAHDFVYAWRRVLDPANGSAYAFLLFDIKHARAYYNKEMTDPAQLGFRAVDDYTLEVQLDRPIAFFLEIMSFTISLPQRQDVIERYGDAFTEAGRYVTNGPFYLEQWHHESDMTLLPNPHYYGTPPRIKGARLVMIPEPNTSLIMYENDELDFVETASSMPMKEVRRVKHRSDYYRKPVHGIAYYGFSTQKPPFNNPLVRKAFIHAFDRSYIPKLFQSGEIVQSSWISPGLFAYEPTIGLTFDLKKARAYLAEAGYPEGKGFPKVELWYANTTPEIRQMAEVAQFQWQHHLGVPVELKTVEWKVYLRQLADDPPQLFRLQWYVDYPDPDSFLGVFISESGNGHLAWKNKTYDDLVFRAAVEPDETNRKALYDKAQRLLLEEHAVMMPLYVVPKSYLLKPNITGFQYVGLHPILDHVAFSTQK